MGKYYIFSCRGAVTRRLSAIKWPFVAFDLISICNGCFIFLLNRVKSGPLNTTLQNYACNFSSMKEQNNEMNLPSYLNSHLHFCVYLESFDDSACTLADTKIKRTKTEAKRNLILFTESLICIFLTCHTAVNRHHVLVKYGGVTPSPKINNAKRLRL